MDQQATKQRYKRHKIETYVSLKDVNRLKSICKKYDFGSVYQLLKYLIDCFLRVADPTNDDNDMVVPHAIEEMFISPKEYHRIKRQARRNKSSKKFEFQLLIPFGEFLTKRTRRLIINDQGMKMADEIKDMFDTNTDWETEESSSGSHQGMIIKQKPDQRKYKTPDDIK